jgi:hypothetical protein
MHYFLTILALAGLGLGWLASASWAARGTESPVREMAVDRRQDRGRDHSGVCQKAAGKCV